ncbi:MAG TPA: OadG family protein [Fervidobacterium sp.]|nr:OadG family protein [Fervidobacterium sp.]HQQ17858.1 OadG family protein [Fervidobacterium sp.]
MNEPNGIAVFIVGITTVFAIFVILYSIFRFMALFSSRTNKKMKTPSSGQEKLPSELTESTAQQNGNVELYASEEEIAAVFAAIYTVMGDDVTIRSIYRKGNARSTNSTKGQRDWVEWRNHGWRGGNRW